MRRVRRDHGAPDRDALRAPVLLVWAAFLSQVHACSAEAQLDKDVLAWDAGRLACVHAADQSDGLGGSLWLMVGRDCVADYVAEHGWCPECYKSSIRVCDLRACDPGAAAGAQAAAAAAGAQVVVSESKLHALLKEVRAASPAIG